MKRILRETRAEKNAQRPHAQHRASARHGADHNRETFLGAARPRHSDMVRAVRLGGSGTFP